MAFASLWSAERDKRTQAAKKTELPFHEQPLWVDEMEAEVEQCIRNHKRRKVQEKARSSTFARRP